MTSSAEQLVNIRVVKRSISKARLEREKRSRAILSEAQAIEIFTLKFPKDIITHRLEPSAGKVASGYGVSEKTVRDIWKGRTWRRSTLNLDPSQDADAPKKRLKQAMRMDACRPEKLQPYRICLNQMCLWCSEAARRDQCRKPELNDTAKSIDFYLFTMSQHSEASEPADPFHSDWPAWERDSDSGSV